jgi:hypothetical protein
MPVLRTQQDALMRLFIEQGGLCPRLKYQIKTQTMKTLKTFIVGLVALAVSAVAIPAQAHDGRHWSHHNYRHYSHGRVVVYGGYRPYYYDDYYAPRYTYYRPYYRPYYYGGPSISFAFGGHGFHHHHW